MPLCTPNTDHRSRFLDRPPPLLPVPSTTHLCLHWLPSALRREGQHMLHNQEYLPSKIWDGRVASRSMTGDRHNAAHAQDLRVGRTTHAIISEVWVCSWWVLMLGQTCCSSSLAVPCTHSPRENVVGLHLWETQMSPKAGGFILCCPPSWRGANASSWGGNEERGSQEVGSRCRMPGLTSRSPGKEASASLESEFKALGCQNFVKEISLSMCRTRSCTLSISLKLLTTGFSELNPQYQTLLGM